jgi:hypothetical protein
MQMFVCQFREQLLEIRREIFVAIWAQHFFAAIAILVTWFRRFQNSGFVVTKIRIFLLVHTVAL